MHGGQLERSTDARLRCRPRALLEHVQLHLPGYPTYIRNRPSTLGRVSSRPGGWAARFRPQITLASMRPASASLLSSLHTILRWPLSAVCADVWNSGVATLGCRGETVSVPADWKSAGAFSLDRCKCEGDADGPPISVVRHWTSLSGAQVVRWAAMPALFALEAPATIP